MLPLLLLCAAFAADPVPPLPPQEARVQRVLWIDLLNQEDHAARIRLLNAERALAAADAAMVERLTDAILVIDALDAAGRTHPAETAAFLELALSDDADTRAAALHAARDGTAAPTTPGDESSVQAARIDRAPPAPSPPAPLGPTSSIPVDAAATAPTPSPATPGAPVPAPALEITARVGPPPTPPAPTIGRLARVPYASPTTTSASLLAPPPPPWEIRDATGAPLTAPDFAAHVSDRPMVWDLDKERRGSIQGAILMGAIGVGAIALSGRAASRTNTAASLAWATIGTASVGTAFVWPAVIRLRQEQPANYYTPIRADSLIIEANTP